MLPRDRGLRLNPDLCSTLLMQWRGRRRRRPIHPRYLNMKRNGEVSSRVSRRVRALFG